MQGITTHVHITLVHNKHTFRHEPHALQGKHYISASCLLVGETVHLRMATQSALRERKIILTLHRTDPTRTCETTSGLKPLRIHFHNTTNFNIRTSDTIFAKLYH